MKKSLLKILAVLAFATVTPSVSAQPRSPQPSREDRRAVNRLVRQALQLQHQPETAADRFLQAYDHIPVCVFLANAAALLRSVEARHPDAIRYAQRVMNGDCQPSEDGADRRTAQRVLDALTPPVPPPTPPIASPPVPLPVSTPQPVTVASPPPTPVRELPPIRPFPRPLTLPVRYRETRPVPAAAIGFWIAGGLTLVGGALCLGWYIDAEDNLTTPQNVDVARWARASDTALTVAIPTLITGASLAAIGFAFYALRPTRRVEILPAASSTFTGLQASLRF